MRASVERRRDRNPDLCLSRHLSTMIASYVRDARYGTKE
jgi:hypothetical protein